MKLTPAFKELGKMMKICLIRNYIIILNKNRTLELLEDLNSSQKLKRPIF